MIKKCYKFVTYKTNKLNHIYKEYKNLNFHTETQSYIINQKLSIKNYQSKFINQKFILKKHSEHIYLY